MGKYQHVFAVAAVLAVVLPATSIAGLFGPCGFCGLPFAGCHCAPCATCHLAPAACACSQPVFQTGFRQEQIVTYEDVPRTEIRREAYVEQVPVTTYERVTETVYVPQQVTKLVPRTVVQSQTRYRDVAYQVTQRIARTHRHFVPQPLAGCNACGSAPLFAPASIAPAATVIPTAPVTDTVIPTMPSIQVTPHHSHTEVPEYDDAGWQTVRPRRQSTPIRSGPPVRGTSFSRQAPSAATVWRSRF